MPELTPQLVIFLASVGIFTAIAAYTDLRTRRIPNKLTVPVFVLGLIYQAVFHGLNGLEDAGLGFVVGFGTLFILWIVGGGGGGDVKLVGALSVWLGFQHTLYVLIVSTVFVLIGTMAVVLYGVMTKGIRGTQKKYLATGKQSPSGKKQPVSESVLQKQQRRVMAFAAPIALATWVVLIWKLPHM